MQKFLCIHGHFYQPPRENPWLEAVELQDSAAPFHDWNERITAECYAPNATARLLDGDARIEAIVNNYSRISFNFGPTLLAWMKDKAPDIYDTIIQADIDSRTRFSGHGSALAQCYNHMIMPLSNPRDKHTQVLWGIRDFEWRFGRKPEGMWLPETAADNESLEALASQGIKFTILSPFQANRVRPLAGGNWQDVNGGRVDPSRAYVIKLPSGRKINAFFYDGPLSQAVAFERLLADGGAFARRLSDGFDPIRNWNQLVHIATDGESYGHHHRRGEMALAYALHYIESNNLARITNYGEYLELNPPTHEAQIHQKSAWSCPHGVGRWERNCGCNSGGRSGWNQLWRQPLRHALDWLRDELAPLYEKEARKYFRDPWEARNEYIRVILDRSTESVAGFFEKQAARKLNEEEQITALRLVEMQRHAMLMYTSCGWFFDEISGIETVQVIQYAARALQLAGDLLGKDFEAGFLERLEKAKSNIREHKDGRVIYNKFVKPAIVDREKIAAHYAVSSLFESYAEESRIFSFTVVQEDRNLWSAGATRLAVGRIRVSFEITRNSDVLTYGVLHFGDHNLNCGVRFYQGEESYGELVREMKEAFDRADFPQTIRLMDQHFGASSYSLKNLFRDEQRKVLDQLFATARDDVRHTLQLLTERYTPLQRFLADLRVPAPDVLRGPFELVLNSKLRHELEQDTLDLEKIHALLHEAERDAVALDSQGLGYAMKAHLDRLCGMVQDSPEDVSLLPRFSAAAEAAYALPFDVNLWKPQNVYQNMRRTLLPAMAERARQGDEHAKAWADEFHTLGERLGFRMNGNGG